MISKPKRAVTLKIKQATPSGATFITKPIRPTVTWPRLSRKFSNGCAFSFDTIVNPIPIIKVKKITASISPLAAA
jgi:hypothetical protein